jgi:hypothetical protein
MKKILKHFTHRTPIDQLVLDVAYFNQIITELQETIDAFKTEIEKRDKHIEMLERHIKIAENALIRQDKWQND